MDEQKRQKRAGIESYFRNVAKTENAKMQKTDFSEFLDKNDTKRVLFIMPASIGDVYLCTSLLESLRSRYSRPEWTLYFATDPVNFEILDGNEYIDKLLKYIPEMDDSMLMEGIAGHKGYFDVVYKPYWATQRTHDYSHNGVDVLGLTLNKE